MAAQHPYQPGDQTPYWFEDGSVADQ
jgi:hypothetical protein